MRQALLCINMAGHHRSQSATVAVLQLFMLASDLLGLAAAGHWGWLKPDVGQQHVSTTFLQPACKWSTQSDS